MQQVDCLLSTSYAKEWIESFPLGNGSIGVMDDGNPHNNIISLNDDTLWSGYNENMNRDVDPKVWDDIRLALNKGYFSYAEKLVHDNVLSKFMDTFLPLGSICISRPLGQSSVRNYKRILDMSRGVQEVSFNVDDMAYKKTSFVSNVDKVYTANITTTRRDTAEITMSSKLASNISVDESEMTITLSGNAPSFVAPIYHSANQNVVYDSSKPSIKYYAALKITTNGEIEVINNGFRISNYTALRLVYSSNTDFRMKDGYKGFVDTLVKRASEISFDRLQNNHILDFSKYYNRCSLKLDFKAPNSVMSTYDLMRKFQQDDTYLEAVVCLFNLGRYLMISASRKGTEAMNLQGIWNNTLRPPWCSNYTVNINTEMNYWGAEIVGLGECHEPLLSFIKRLHRNGQETAKRTYNCGGFTVAHNTDIWAHTNPVGGDTNGSSSVVYGYNITTAAWLCEHLFMHYEFSGDVQFLAKTAYPIMLDAARFYLDYMTKDNATGYLVPSPSTSPENNFRVGFKWHSLCKASTMDIAAIKSLFKNIIKASDILKDNNPIINEIESALPMIYPYKISKKGTLQEWYGDYKETDKHHRHISHLYALHPTSEITPDKTPELAKAAEASLKRRGNGGTGWSMAWKINAWARLKNGDTAFELIKKQLTPVPSNQSIGVLKGGSYKNMLCAHPPFQIDGNFGAMSGIAEMLIQSHENYIELLPALPTKWANGSFKGLCARGAFVVNAKWANGKVTEFEIQSNYKSEVSVKIGDTCKVYATNKIIKP